MPLPGQTMYPVDAFDLTFRHGEKEMIFQVKETKDSRSLSSGYEVVYIVIANPHSDEMMMEYLFNTAELASMSYPSDEVIIGWNTWLKAGCTFYNNHLAKKWPPECKRLNDNQYEVRIKYAPLFILNFQILPIKTNRKTSYDWEVHSFPIDGGEPSYSEQIIMGDPEKEYHQFINVDTHGAGTKQGEVKGVDVIEPSFTWTERWSWGPQSELRTPLPPIEFTFDYHQILAQLTATVNDGPFRGFVAGDVLFTGASGRRSQPLLWEIDYNFHFKPGKVTERIGNHIIAWNKPWARGGHNVTDIETIRKDIELQSAGGKTRRIIVPNPLSVTRHKVYESGNFNHLQIQDKIPLSASQFFSTDPAAPEAIDFLPSIGGLHTRPPVEAI